MVPPEGEDELTVSGKLLLLLLWLVSPGYLAVIVSVPGFGPGVYDMEQVVVAPVPLKLQYPAKLPAPLVVNVTCPDGEIAVPEGVSMTATVHVVADPLPATTVEGVQVIVAVVTSFGRFETASVNDWLPVLVLVA